MTQEQSSVTKSKKMVSRNVAIVLGVICIFLIVVIAIFSVTGISAQNSYNNLKNQNSQLQTWLDGNETLLGQTQAWLSGNATAYQNELNQYNLYFTDHHHTDEDYNALNSYNANLSNIINLSDSLVLADSQTISQPANSYTIWSVAVGYAGYVSVFVQSSTVAGTHVQTNYTAYGVSFSQEITVSAGNTAVFPILPSSNIRVEVGNGDLLNGATETVTITYYY